MRVWPWFAFVPLGCVLPAAENIAGQTGTDTSTSSSTSSSGGAGGAGASGGGGTGAAGGSGGLCDGIPCDGLVLWLDAHDLSVLSDSPVETWADHIDSSRKATASGAKAPTFVQNGISSAPNHPGVKFDAVAQQVLDLPDDLGQQQPLFQNGMHVFAMVKTTEDQTSGLLYLGGTVMDSDSVLGFTAGAASFSVGAAFVVSATSFPAGVAQVVEADVAGDAADLNVDCGVPATFSPLSFAAASTPNAIGRDVSEPANGYFSGHLGELIVYRRRLQPPESDQVRAHLEARWGWSCP